MLHPGHRNLVPSRRDGSSLVAPTGIDFVILSNFYRPAVHGEAVAGAWPIQQFAENTSVLLSSFDDGQASDAGDLRHCGKASPPPAYLSQSLYTEQGCSCFGMLIGLLLAKTPPQRLLTCARWQAEHARGMKVVSLHLQSRVLQPATSAKLKLT